MLREANKPKSASRKTSNGKRASRKSKASPEARATRSSSAISRVTPFKSSHGVSPPNFQIVLQFSSPLEEEGVIGAFGWNLPTAFSERFFIAKRLFIQQGDVLALRRHGYRFQVRVDIGQVLIGKSLARVRRHLDRRLADVALKALEGKLRRADARRARLRRALAHAAVALVAAVAHKKLLSIFGVSRRWRVGSLLRARNRQGEQPNCKREKNGPSHRAQLLLQGYDSFFSEAA